MDPTELVKAIRASIDRNYLRACFTIAESGSTCLSRKVGAMLIGSTHPSQFFGYSGTGDCTCSNAGCLRSESPHGEDLENCRGIHAEQMALLQASNYWCEDSSLYITDSPCSTCAKMIIYRRVKRVIYCRYYPGSDLAMSLLEAAGIEVTQIKEADLWG